MALSYKNDNRSDERLDPYESNSKHLQELENNFNDSSDTSDINDIENYANNPANSTKNIDNARSKEETAPGTGWKNNTGQNTPLKPGGNSSRFNIKAIGKKKGATGAIIALVLGGGVLGTSLFSPALLLVHVKNVFMNDLSDATPSQTIRSDLMMRNKIKGLQVKAGVCTSKVSIRCKFSTMSNRQIKKFEKAGFSVEKDKSIIPGRSGISSMTYTHEDGHTTTIKTPQEMKDFARTPEGRSALFKAFNPKTDYFLNGDFSKMLKTKLGISKESKVKPGDEKEVKSSINESTGASEAADPKEGGRFKNALGDTEKLGNTATKANAATAALGTACLSYNTSSKIIYTVKAVKLAAFAAFAMTFLTETDKLVAGDADPEVISQLGSQLTSVDSRKTIQDENGATIKNPDYGKSPTDSQGYQLAANNTAASDGTASNFSLAPVGFLASLAALVALPNKIPGGKVGLKSVCKIVGNSLVGGTAIMAACIASAGIGDVAGAILCGAVQTAVGIAVGIAVGKGISHLTSEVIKHYGPMLLNADTFGTAVGNGYFAGAAAILGGVAAASGMMPANKSSLKKYFADTDSIRKEQTAADVYVAKSTPFDIYNQYSFLGSIVQPINSTVLSSNSTLSKVAGLFSLFPKSFASLTTAGAEYNEAAQPYNSKRFNQCDDQELKDIGVDGDELCNIRYTMSSTELSMDPDTNVQYMVNSGAIDEDTGEPKTNTSIGKDYQKFLDNCVNRKDPLGATDKEIQDANDWDTGKNCGPDSSVNQTELSNFRVFTMDMQTEDAMDQDPSADNGGGTTTPPSSSPTTESAQELAKEMLKNSNISYIYDAKQDVTLASQGKAGTCKAAIDPQLLAVANDIGKNHKVIISAIESHCTGHMKGSDHYKGKAIDFAQIDGVVAYKKIASVWPDISKDASGAYFLQRQCVGGSTPSGMSWLSGDTCSHVHMSLKAG